MVMSFWKSTHNSLFTNSKNIY
ncbi:UNVERIFIED_CONTAM: hypothetical protein GTU68_012680 [Idotea baltica]|nr:hypothetical protein [Idotea baltica]